MEIAERVQDLLTPIVATLGVELLDVEFSGNALRLTVDEESGGITTERLAEVNRLVSPVLDQHDPVPGRYTLEVSSPGLERPLKRVEHYQRAVGEEIILKLAPGHEPRRLRGELVDAVAPSDEPARVTITATEIDGVELAEGQAHTIELDSVAKARTVFEWGPAPKPGQPGAKKAKASGPQTKSKTPSKPRGAR